MQESKTDRKDVYFLGDIHLGSNFCDLDSLHKTIDEIRKNKYAHVILMGDLIECGIIGRFGLWDQSSTPMQQVNDIVTLFTPIKDKIDFSIGGNHEARIFRETSIDISQIIAEKLNCQYIGIGGIINKYGPCIVAFHGTANSTSPELELRRAYLKYPEADIIALGHVHQLYAKQFLSYDKNGKEHLCYWIRTGGFLKQPDYAQIKFFPETQIGCPMVRIERGSITTINSGIIHYDKP